MGCFIFVIVLIAIAGGTTAYFAYQDYQNISASNNYNYSQLQSTRQELENTRQELDTKSNQINQLDSSKTYLENEKRNLLYDKSSLKSDLSTIKDYYQNALNSHQILYPGKDLFWNGELSSNNTTMWTVPILIDQDSYFDISLYDLTEGSDADFEIYYQNGNTVSSSRQTQTGSDSLYNFYLGKGSYQIKVWLSGSNTTTYTLKVYRRN